MAQFRKKLYIFLADFAATNGRHDFPFLAESITSTNPHSIAFHFLLVSADTRIAGGFIDFPDVHISAQRSIDLHVCSK
jgi:hypothetical protein